MNDHHAAGGSSLIRRLPERYFLSYVISHEAWYADKAEQGRVVVISATNTHGASAWAFHAEEEDLGGYTSVSLSIPGDAFNGLTQVPELFQALAEYGEMERIEELIGVLAGLGARDITVRTRPAEAGSEPTPACPGSSNDTTTPARQSDAGGQE